MMRTVLKFSVFLTILAGFCEPAYSGLGFLHETSITIPGLTGPIQQIQFKDINGDGVPEVLACDSTKIVLYSLALDSVLFHYSVDSGSLVTQILLDDVNRDGIPDITAGFFMRPNFGYDSAVVLSWSGAAKFQSVAHWSIPLKPTYSCPPPDLSVFQTVDLDHEGHRELLISGDTIAPDNSSYCYFLNEKTVGVTRLFHAFPDSTLWSSEALFSKASEFDLSSRERALWGETFHCDICEVGSGLGYGSQLTGRQLVDSVGHMTNIQLAHRTFACDSLPPFDTGASLSMTYVGDLDGDHLSNDALFTYGQWLHCRPDSSFRERKDLELQRFGQGTLVSLLWSIDITGTDYKDFLYHPQLPGTFFAFSGDTLLMIRGSDGSIRDRLTQVPAGTRHWDYPYSDSIPRLIVINGATVSIYKLDIATDVADQNRNRSLPTEFTLSNPFPNPFNPSSFFTVGTGPGGALDVAIFNTLGQRVLTLFDGKVKANSNMTFHWEMPQRASGIYFVRAQLGGAALVRKMLFLK